MQMCHKAPLLLSSQQGSLQTAVGINANSNTNTSTAEPSSQFVAFQRMMADYQALAVKQSLFDTGVQTSEDIEYFYEHLHYPAQDISNVQILIGYGIRGQGADPTYASVTRYHPASECATFPELMTATKSDWDDLFLDLNLSPSAAGIHPNNLVGWTKKTYGGHTSEWIEAPRLGEYSKWFRDYAVHGRNALLFVLMRYNGPVREQSKSTKGGTRCNRTRFWEVHMSLVSCDAFSAHFRVERTRGWRLTSR